MDFEYTPEQEAFRQEVRRWLEAPIIMIIGERMLGAKD